MEFFVTLYHTLLYQPIFNILIALTKIIPGNDFGIAIIILTVLVRAASYPLGAQGVRMQKKLADIQPKLKEIQEKFKNKREEQTQAMMELYRSANINPFAIFLPLLMQLPIFIVLYQMFAHGIQQEQLSMLYSFVQAPETLNPSFLGLVNLNEKSLILAVAAGVLQFLQFKQSNVKKPKRSAKKQDMSSMMQTQMTYIFPVVIVFVAFRLPAAFALYWISTTLFSLWQYWFIMKRESYAEQRTTSNN